ncbi:MAG: hypothetical protein RBG13Loki_0586 [Promethearchaeota archaeon CR_4]|nr:MAG: hypothetical protein RBG13Loki_0586 [Candidatus Lokiarchaeota archaeon CR_4]
MLGELLQKSQAGMSAINWNIEKLNIPNVNPNLGSDFYHMREILILTFSPVNPYQQDTNWKKILKHVLENKGERTSIIIEGEIDVGLIFHGDCSCKICENLLKTSPRKIFINFGHKLETIKRH